jgi:hypothetical protein
MLLKKVALAALVTCSAAALAGPEPEVVVVKHPVQDFAARVVRGQYLDAKLVLTNKSPYAWTDCIATLNGGYRIALDMKPGESVFRLDDFVTGSNLRFNFIAFRPSQLRVTCRKPQKASTVFSF